MAVTPPEGPGDVSAPDQGRYGPGHPYEGGEYSPPFHSAATRFCTRCGTQLMLSTWGCPRCGASLSAPKDKTVAILLAVFLSWWTWLYTYQQDSTKFWVGLGVGIFGTLMLLVFGLGFFILLGLWIWAIVDVAIRPEEWYRSYVG